MKTSTNEKYFQTILKIFPLGFFKKEGGKYYACHGFFKEEIEADLLKRLVDLKYLRVNDWLLHDENKKHYVLTHEAENLIRNQKRYQKRYFDILQKEIIFSCYYKSWRAKIIFSFGDWGYAIGKNLEEVKLFLVKESARGSRWKGKEISLSDILNDELRKEIELKLKDE